MSKLGQEYLALTNDDMGVPTTNMKTPEQELREAYRQHELSTFSTEELEAELDRRFTEQAKKDDPLLQNTLKVIEEWKQSLNRDTVDF